MATCIRRVTSRRSATQGQVFFKHPPVHRRSARDLNELRRQARLAAGVYYQKSKNNLSGDIDFITINFTENDFFHTDTKSGLPPRQLQARPTSSASLWACASPERSKDANLDHPPLFNRTILFEVTANLHGLARLLQLPVHRRHDGVRATVATGSRPAGITTIVNTDLSAVAVPGRRSHQLRSGLQDGVLQSPSALQHGSVLQRLLSTRLDLAGRLPVPGGDPASTRRLTAAECPPARIGWQITIGTPAEIQGVEFEATAGTIDRSCSSTSPVATTTSSR